jgi:hypothetical protein
MRGRGCGGGGAAALGGRSGVGSRKFWREETDVPLMLKASAAGAVGGGLPEGEHERMGEEGGGVGRSQLDVPVAWFTCDRSMYPTGVLQAIRPWGSVWGGGGGA